MLVAAVLPLWSSAAIATMDASAAALVLAPSTPFQA